MRVFVTGGTGSIGTAVLTQLVAEGHQVTALTRSQSARQKVQAVGGTPYAGDLRTPDDWVRQAVQHHAIVHLATTFEDDMAETDDQVVSALLSEAVKVPHRLRLVYTGGCWLYGETGDEVADEDRPFAPLPAFAWMVRNARRLLDSDLFATAVVHPAMVYHEDGGAFARFLDAVRGDDPIEIWGTAQARWPLIHRRDLANVYAGLVARPDLVGHFNAVAETGIAVRQIADAIAAHWGRGKPHRIIPSGTLRETYGDWALGPSLDQQMRGDKLERLLGWRPNITDFRQSDVFCAP